MGQAFLQEGWQNQVKGSRESLCKDEGCSLPPSTQLQRTRQEATPPGRDWSRKEHVTHYWPIRPDEEVFCKILENVFRLLRKYPRMNNALLSFRHFSHAELPGSVGSHLAVKRETSL